jgi:hypothetical protein
MPGLEGDLYRVGLAGGDPRFSAIFSITPSDPFASVPSMTSFMSAIVWSKLLLRLLGAVRPVVPKENRRPCPGFQVAPSSGDPGLIGEPKGDSPRPGDSFGLDNIGGVLSDGLPGPPVRKGDAGASSSASISSGGSRSLVMSARRLWFGKTN